MIQNKFVTIPETNSIALPPIHCQPLQEYLVRPSREPPKIEQWEKNDKL